MPFINIVACDEKFGISKKKSIPWHHPDDLKFFKEKTINNVVIMGRLTYESLGRNLNDRVNCVISKTMENKNGVEIFKNPWECVKWCIKYHKNKTFYVIGGGEIYKWFLDNNLIDEEYITMIEGDYKCDIFYTYNTYNTNVISKRIKTFTSVDNKNTSNYKLRVHYIFHRKFINKEEKNMLNTINYIINNGIIKKDRTGVGTLSSFGHNFRFDLTNNNFPLMTSRKLFFRGIFEELMFYIRGETDTKILSDKGINVWNDNTNRSFLDSRGLIDLPDGDMGHSYGFSFRHFGAEYMNCYTDYKGKGFDQLYYVINEIKNNPNSRRLIISLWEPNNMHRASLPPCLYQYQFYVSGGYLSCMMTQRSSDFILAGGWNVATGALFTYLIAYFTGYKPRELIWNIGDIHIYNNGIDSALAQVKRTPNIYPKLFLKNMPFRIEDVKYENVEIINYNPQSNISVPMNA